MQSSVAMKQLQRIKRIKVMRTIAGIQNKNTTNLAEEQCGFLKHNWIGQVYFSNQGYHHSSFCCFKSSGASDLCFCVLFTEGWRQAPDLQVRSPP